METTITLTVAECKIAKYIALKRQEVDRKKSVVNRSSLPPAAQLNASYESYCAELAVCRALNIYPGLTHAVESIPNPDGLYRGIKIDVKWTRGTNLNLHKKARRNPAKIYILVKGHAPDFELVGWMPREAIEQARYYVPERQMNGRKLWPHYSVPQNELWLMNNLDSWITRWGNTVIQMIRQQAGMA